jgi:hypothetical protein
MPAPAAAGFDCGGIRATVVAFTSPFTLPSRRFHRSGTRKPAAGIRLRAAGADRDATPANLLSAPS